MNGKILLNKAPLIPHFSAIHISYLPSKHGIFFVPSLFRETLFIVSMLRPLLYHTLMMWSSFNYYCAPQQYVVVKEHRHGVTRDDDFLFPTLAFDLISLI